jgi:hypothetical protein
MSGQDTRLIRMEGAPLTRQTLRDAVAAANRPRAIHCGLLVRQLLRYWGMGDDYRFRVGRRQPLVTALYHQRPDAIDILDANGGLLARIEGFSTKRADYDDLPQVAA